MRVRVEHLGVGRNAHHHQVDRPVGPRAQLRGPLQDAVGRVIREPRVAEREHPVQHARPVAADQHRRMGPLGRLRPGPDPLELHVLARVARFVGRPDRLHGLDPFPHNGHPPPRVGAVVGHLLPVPAGADAELEPPAGQVVDAGHLLGRGDRVPLDDQADAGADPQPRGGGHRGGHRDEQVEGVRVLARQRTAARMRCRPAGRDVRVLGEEQRLVPALLGEPRQVRGRDGIVGREDRYAGVHAFKA